MRKTRTGRKLLSLLLTLTMVLGLMPAMGITAGASGLNAETNVLTIDTTDPASGDGWDWDGTTLTLSGVDLTQLKFTSSISSATIVLEGANQIERSDDVAAVHAWFSDITIEGSGTLACSSIDTSALTVNSGYLTVASPADGPSNAIGASTMTINGGYVKASNEKSNSIALYAGNGGYTQTGGYVQATGKMGLHTTNAATISGGYLDISGDGVEEAVEVYSNESFTNSGGVVNAQGTKYGIAATTANFTGGVSIVKGATKAFYSTYTTHDSAISGLGTDDADEGLFVGGAGEKTAPTTSTATSVVIAKAVTQPSAADGKFTFDGVYLIYDGWGFDSSGKPIDVTGGCYVEAAGAGSYGALTCDGAAMTISGTLVALVTEDDSSDVLRVGDGSITVTGNLISLSVSPTTSCDLSINDGSMVAISTDKYTISAENYSQLGDNSNVVVISEEMDALSVSESFSISGGCLTTETTASSYYALDLSESSISFTGGTVTAISNSDCVSTDSALSMPAGKGVCGSLAKYDFLQSVVFDEDDEEYQLGDDSCSVLFFGKSVPAPVFNDGFGTTGCTFDTYNKDAENSKGYTFAGWFGPEGTEITVASAAVNGKTYTAKWTKGGKTVVTTPLDFTEMENTDKLTDEGWAWYATASEPYAAKTLVLDGATIDCSGVTDTFFAIELPAGATVKLTGTNTVKSGVKNGDSKIESYAIYAFGAVEFKGNGSLEVAGSSIDTTKNQGTSSAIQSKSGNVTFSDSVQVTASAGNVTASGTNAYAVSRAVSAQNGSAVVIINDSATVTATAGNATGIEAAYSQGVVAAGINVNGGGLTAFCGTPTAEEETAQALGGSLTATGATIKAGADSSGTEETYTNQKWLNVSFVPTITFNSNGGSAVAAVTATGSPGSYTITVPAAPTFSPYTFGGWYNDAALTASAELTAGAVIPVTAGKTVYAKWTNASGKAVVTTPLLLAELEDGNPAADVSNDAAGWSWAKNEDYDDEEDISATNNSGTLTLNGATIDCSGVTDCDCAIILPAGAILSITGTNTVKAGNNSSVEGVGDEYSSYGIASFGTHQILGSGTLNVTSSPTPYESIGIYGTVIIGSGEDSPTVNTTSTEANHSYGIQGNTIVNSGTLTARGSNGTFSSGIEGELTVNGGSVTAISGTTTSPEGFAKAITDTLTATGATIKAGENAEGADTTYTDQKWVNVSFVSAVMSNVTLTGSKNSAVTPVSGVTLTLTGDTFKDVAVDTVFGTNVAGITATVKAVTAKTATVTLSGTPTEIVNGTLTVTIPAANLTKNAALTTATNANAKAQIKVSAVLPRTTAADFTDDAISYKDVYGNTQSGTLAANITDSGEGWAWYVSGNLTVDDVSYTPTAAAPVLVLSGCDITAPADDDTSVLELPADTTVVVKHDTVNSVVNSLSAENCDDEDDIYGIYGNSSLVIAGDGSLQVTYDDSSLEASTSAIYAENDLIITDATITVGDPGEYVLDCAIEAGSGALSIEDSNVTAYARGNALAAVTDLTIANSTVNGTVNDPVDEVGSNLWSVGSITVDGSTVNTWGGYDGLGAYGDITIQNGSTVTCEPLEGYESNTEFGIAIEDSGSGTITITDSTVTATSGSSTSESVYGIYNYDGDIVVTNSTVTATAGSATGVNKYSIGIYPVTGDMTVTNSTVNATAGSAMGNSLGIAVDLGTLTTTNSTVNGTAGASSASGSSMGSFGISSASGSIAVNGGSVTGTAGTAGVSAISVGVFAGDTINVTAGTLTGNSAPSGLSAGMAAGGSITYASSLGIVSPSGGVKKTLSGMETIAASATAQGPAGSASIGTPAPASSGGGGGAPSVTVPASSDEGSAKVSATVSGGRATISASDTQIKAIASGTKDTGTVKVDASALKVDEAVIPAKLVNAAAAASGSEGLEVLLPTGSVTLDKTALESVGNKSITVSVEDVKPVTLTPAQKETLGEQADTAVVVDINVLVNGVKTSNFNGGVISVSVPYTPKAGEDTSKLAVWYLADDGSIEAMNGKYNAATKCFEFTTTHLSTYVLVSFPFTDVAAGSYYYDAVVWAVAGGVTDGKTADTFAPAATCTRAQTVTFLWRAMGSPEPTATTCQFTDVKADAYYYKAVLWAVEKGVTKGTDATTFAPNATVTRGQVVTFLWRAAGSKAVTAANPFTDVAANTYCTDAVLWAVSEKITDGTTAATFSPANPCTRAQIVTFLYRHLAK